MKNEWVAGILGGPKPFANFEYSSLLTETILLGNVAVSAGVPLVWPGGEWKLANIVDYMESGAFALNGETLSAMLERLTRQFLKP